MNKAVSYTRVSSDEQAREGISLEAQEAKIRAYAELNGLNLLEVITDAGKSGKNLQRPGVQRLIQLCEEKQIGHIIVYRLDRLSRKVKDLLNLVDDTFLRNGIEIHSLSEKLDTSSPQGRFFFTLMGALSQMERDLVSQRTKDVLAHKKAKGDVLGAPPFGFKLQTGKLVPNEVEAEALMFATNLRQDGMTFRQIFEALEERGFMPRRGKSWSLGSLHNLIARAPF